MDLGPLLEKSGAMLRGHFLLTSGRHSDVYIEKFRVLECPEVLSDLCAEIAGQCDPTAFDLVAGPTTGGIIIAFELARQVGKHAVYIESEGGLKTLRRNKVLEPGARVLIVDDVLTTGTSLLESRAAIERFGGSVVGYATLIDRSAPDLDLGLPLISGYRVEAKSYAATELPAWLAEIPVSKPGTRAVAAT